MLKTVQVASDLLREAVWRKWFLGLFAAITVALIVLGATLKLDIVDGAIAGSSFFGEMLFSDIKSVNAFLGPLFMGTTVLAAMLGAAFLAVACSDFAPSLLSPGRIEHLLSLPVTRPQLLLGTWAGGMAIAVVSTAYGTLGLIFVLGVKTGVWNFKLLLGALLGMSAFAAVYAAMMLAAVTVRSAAFSSAVGLLTLALGILSSARASVAKAIDPGLGRLAFEWSMVPIPKLGTLSVRAAFLAGGRAIDTTELFRLWAGTALFAAALLVLAAFLFERKDF